MKGSELLFDVVTGGRILNVDHPLFEETWSAAENAYNEFVTELDLNDKQISKLLTLIDYKCAVERLGYYSALQVGLKISATDMKRAELLFEYLGMEDIDQRRVLGFVKGLVDGKKKRQAS